MTEQDMADQENGSRPRMVRIAIIATSVAAGLVVAGFVVWSIRCPCDRTPGGMLFGETAEAQIADWSFANDVPLCQIQIAALVPYSINLNCMATSTGELYLSCSVCDLKRWAGIVVDNGRARMRLDRTVYPVTATRIFDPAELDRAWVARVDKLQVHSSPINPAVPVGTPRPDRWWSFRIVSR